MPWRLDLHKWLRFFTLAVKKARHDDLAQKSAALAFTTIVSLVPLLAAFSFLGAGWFSAQQSRVVEALIAVLPYTEETMVVRLEEFIRQAQSIRGIGFAAFIVAALTIFGSIERTINEIWNVPRHRPFRSRLVSFTMMLFWGPLVIGAAYGLLFYLRQQRAFQVFTSSVTADFIPLSMTLLGLSMLYWLVPYTQVGFRSALTGGAMAALLLEALRSGFGLYVAQAQNFSLIYGGFGLVLLFMISIQVGWWIVLLGSEVAYCVQNFRYLSTPRRFLAKVDESWIALAALAFITYRFRQGKTVTPPEALGDRLQIEVAHLQRVLTPAVEAGLLREMAGDGEGYVLARDPHTIEITEALGLHTDQDDELLEALPEDLSGPLRDLRRQLLEARRASTTKITLADLAGTPPSSSSVPNPAAE